MLKYDVMAFSHARTHDSGVCKGQAAMKCHAPASFAARGPYRITNLEHPDILKIATNDAPNQAGLKKKEKGPN